MSTETTTFGAITTNEKGQIYDGIGEQFTITERPGAQGLTKIELARTIQTSANYEFARIEVIVSVRGDIGDRDTHRKWCRSTAVEIMSREEDSLNPTGRTNKAISEVPSTISYGELFLSYNRTVSTKKGHTKVGTGESRFFGASVASFMEAYAALEKRLSDEFESFLKENVG